MARANGDALVMHVGERPYVVTQAGPIDLSTHALNLQAMKGMLAQLIPNDLQQALNDIGAVEHRLPSSGDDQFSVVAARGGDDIWIEIRRRRAKPVVAAPTAPESKVESKVVVMPVELPPEAAPGPAIASVLASSASSVVQRTEPPQPPSMSSPELTAAAKPDAEPVQPVSVPPPTPPEAPLMAEVAREASPPSSLVARAAMVAVPEEETVVAESSGVEAVADSRIVIAPEVIESTAAPAVAVAVVPSVEAHADAVTVGVTEPRVELAATASGPPQPEAPASTGQAPPIGPGSAPPTSTAPPAEATDAPDAPVPPLTRTVRIEVPARTATGRVGSIERLLRVAGTRGASTLFLSSQSRPYVRIDGDMRMLDNEPVLASTDIEAALLEIVPDAMRDPLARGSAVEWITEFAELGRVRCASFRDHRGAGALFRLTSTRAATSDQLGLEPEVQALATEAEGLVLVTGPRGSGRSTLVSAFIDLINRQRADYVITLERELRLLHENRLALISQREVRSNGDQFLAAVQAAVRESPDVLMVEDLASGDVLAEALDAAGQGMLVVVSMAAASTVDGVRHLIELSPSDRQGATRAMLAEHFRGAVAQLLLRKAGGGRMAAREVLLGTGLVSRLITEGQLNDLPAALESGRKYGMAPLSDVLVGLVQRGVVDVREAYRKSGDRERLLTGLRSAGVDTSFVERLA
jgi:twitching motility protein PilT